MSKISRRKFLAGSMAGGAAVMMSPAKKALAAGAFEGFPEGMGVLVDLSRCVGCRTCEAACNHEQNLPEPALPFDDYSVFDELHHGQKRRPTDKAYTVVNRYEPEGTDAPLYRKIQCNHCNEPACLTSCFVNAYTKTPEGAVIYDSKVCVGCRNCMIACPFHVPAYSYDSVLNPVIKKCIFCYDTRLKDGKPPACVESCPQQVMTFGKRKELMKIAHERISKNPDKYVDQIYGEKEVGGTGWFYISNAPFEEAGFDQDLPKKPIINNVKDFLAIVPMVLTIWPALFTGFHLLATKGKSHGHEDDDSHDGQEDQ